MEKYHLILGEREDWKSDSVIEGCVITSGYKTEEVDTEISKLNRRLETTQEQLEKFMNTNAQQTILIMKLRAQIEKLEKQNRIMLDSLLEVSMSLNPWASGVARSAMKKVEALEDEEE